MKSLYNGIEKPYTLGSPSPEGRAGEGLPPFDDSFYDAVVNELYGNGGYTPDYLTTPNGSALIGETNRVLMDAVTKGVSSITEEPDPTFSAALAQNTFIFSGFKTHQELQEVNSLLHDKDGKLRPFDEFKRDVDKLGKEYNQNYLRAEYNHAVQSAQMAAKCQEFQKHKDFVNLQYRTANDERVRAEHAALHGTTLPVDDKFWTKYLPPLGWNCRCTVVEVLKDSYPESNSDEAVRAGDSATSRPAEKIFRFNPGKELKVFPPKHPYLPKLDKCKTCKLGKNIGLSANGESMCSVCSALQQCMGKTIESKKDKKKENANMRKRVIEEEKGKGIYKPSEENPRLLVNTECDTSKDELPNNTRCALAMLEAFKDMEIKIRPNVIIDHLKNAEYYINGLLADRKGVDGPDGVTSGFVKAIDQGCQVVVIDFDRYKKGQWVDYNLVARNIKRRHQDFEGGIIMECYVVHNGNVARIPGCIVENTDDCIRNIKGILIQRLK
ncbi:MAG: minor capsid protein [Bacteroidales bacterium]|nr:minor capsid protein [Bacteroidales bacterium]